MIPNAHLFPHPGTDALVGGYFLIDRRRQNRVPLPVRVVFAAPVDDDGLPLDRSPRWQVFVADQLLDGDEVRVGGMRIEHLTDIWPRCAGNEISADEYRYRCERAAWAQEHDTNDAFADLGRRIDPMTVSLPF